MSDPEPTPEHHPEPNYDEARVPAYTLPDPLLRGREGEVGDERAWRERRRALLRLFEGHVYGRAPARPERVVVEATPLEEAPLAGAVRKQLTVALGGSLEGRLLRLLLYMPRGRPDAPLFLGLNFFGNPTVQPDPGIRPEGAVDPEHPRGEMAERWPVARIVERGYGLATLHAADLDPDDGFATSVHRSFYRPGQTRPDADEWGTIAAWAWGLRLARDVLEREADTAGRRVAVMGHSRLGKAALWAGAQDERFALVVSNNSGCGGAALSRRRFGETVAAINRRFPTWFCTNFKAYDDHEDALPVDQHTLLALVAPRPVYVASAEDDLWADPRGEFLSVLHADPVYRLLGAGGFEGERDGPRLERPSLGRIGHHLRRGAHEVTAYDWERFLDFADRHLGGGDGGPRGPKHLPGSCPW